MATKNLFIFIIIIAIFILAVFVLFSQPKPSEYQPPKTTEITPLAATGNVADLVKTTLSEITDEENLIKEDENVTFLITSDNQEISDFGQTINESEF